MDQSDDNRNRVLLEAVVGSIAYGLSVPGSDVDRLAVHLAPIAEILGLDTARVTTETTVTADPDRTSHELGKFCALALRCNPTVTELLWAAEYEVRTPAGEMILGERACFLSTDAVRNAYGGYARAQLDRMLRRSAPAEAGVSARAAKHARHCLRLLLQGEELLTTGRLTLDVSAHRERLMRAGETASTDPAAFVTEFEDAIAAFETLPSVLPHTPDREQVNDLVVAVRLEALSH